MNSRPADRLAIAVAQLNPTVGDLAGNAEKARAARADAQRDGADLVAFPELFIAGYPPEDLVLKTAFQAAWRAVVCDVYISEALVGTKMVEYRAELGAELILLLTCAPYWHKKGVVRLNI